MDYPVSTPRAKYLSNRHSISPYGTYKTADLYTCHSAIGSSVCEL